MTGGCLAHGVPEPKAPSSLASEAGSDEGGIPGNGAGFRQDYSVQGQ
ncbi:MAG: hypothetical protein AB2672_08900 [Candidatus Thiodiazotropha endolucinida]